MKNNKGEKPKKQKEEIDFTNITPDDIAKKFLETPPKPKTKKEKDRP